MKHHLIISVSQTEMCDLPLLSLIHRSSYTLKACAGTFCWCDDRWKPIIRPIQSASSDHLHTNSVPQQRWMRVQRKQTFMKGKKRGSNTHTHTHTHIWHIAASSFSVSTASALFAQFSVSWLPRSHLKASQEHEEHYERKELMLSSKTKSNVFLAENMILAEKMNAKQHNHNWKK